MLNPENQTQFSQTQPLQEDPIVLPLKPEEIAAKQKMKRRILIVGGILLIIIAIILLFNFLSSPATKEPFRTFVPKPTPVVTSDTSLRGRIQSAQKELDAIGQTEYQLPLPQVNFDLRL